jgi:hypothetical protein
LGTVNFSYFHHGPRRDEMSDLFCSSEAMKNLSPECARSSFAAGVTLTVGWLIEFGADLLPGVPQLESNKQT